MEIALKTFSRISMKIIFFAQRCAHTVGDCLQEYWFLGCLQYIERIVLLNSFFDEWYQFSDELFNRKTEV